ncbi:13068_t:CDS:2 [Entrophospora sp. SA101]|nr:13068_t:CDS:2 [Entrophospora sp. SA101]
MPETQILPVQHNFDNAYSDVDVRMMNGHIDKATEALINKKISEFNESINRPEEDNSENNNKLDQMLKGNSPVVDSFIINPLGDESLIISNESLSEDEKRTKINKIFSRVVSNGNAEQVSKLLENAKKYIDLDAQDEDGTTPLIYAACFGHESVVYILLEAGAKVDAQDRFGWSPLMWATNNNHHSTVKLLLDNGADAGAKSAKGRTVFDFIPTENQKIAEIFIHNPQRDSWSSAGSLGRWSYCGDNESKLYEQLAEAEMKKRMLMESSLNLEIDLSNILHILKTVITNIQPIRSKAQKPVPANVIFLSTRFAHYFSSPELLDTLLLSVIDSIDQTVKTKPEDMTLLSFWISNCTLLLYYLKKDTGLVAATVEYQLRISELLHEIYVLLVRDAERRLDRVLEASMLEYDTIPGIDDVRFEGEWRVFRTFVRRSRSPQNEYTTATSKGASLKRSSSTSTSKLPSFRPSSPRQRSIPSPRNVTSLLSSTLFVLQTYGIHPMIVEQTLNQLFYFISCELFNKIISNKKYLCRSKAMQIRLNVSAIEDWVRTNNLSITLISHFKPLIQLLQLLMCWSQMTDFATLVQTTKELSLVNPAQLKRVSKNYRYEVNEPRITEECQQYILQLEEDTERRKKRYSTESIRSDGSDTSSIIYLTVSPTVPECTNGPTSWDDEDELMEMKDSELLLPFAIPTSTEMLANYGNNGGKEKDNEFIPVVPDEWMEKLDLGMKHGSPVYRWTQDCISENSSIKSFRSDFAEKIDIEIELMPEQMERLE